MKILKKNYGHRNLIIFLVLSLVYLQVVYSLAAGTSFFTLSSLREFFTKHYLIMGLTLVTGVMVIKVKKYSELVLMFCLIIIVGKNFILLSGSFNKLTLVLSFIYLIFAFYFFIMWEIEVGFALYNPKYSKFDLQKESRFRISASIQSLKTPDNTETALITNIDEYGCFLMMSENANLKLDTSQKFHLKAIYEGVVFEQEAQLVTAYDHGIGLAFSEQSNTRLSWSELYKVCLERGLVS